MSPIGRAIHERFEEVCRGTRQAPAQNRIAVLFLVVFLADLVLLIVPALFVVGLL